MLLLSLVFHACVFFAIIFVPDSLPSRRVKGVVYEVNLVEMPGSGGVKGQGTGQVKAKKGTSVVTKDSKARRITAQKKEKKPVIIAKRTTKRKSSSVKKPKASSSQLIDRAISKIERKVKSEDVGDIRIENAISRIEGKVGGQPGPGRPGAGSPNGISVRLYQMEVEMRIKGNWSYPVAAGNQTALEAVVIIKVGSDGTIMKSRFEARSGDNIFDQSVMKAIERSDPLPPFPEGYRRSYDEIEINFNLKDLEGY